MDSLRCQPLNYVHNWTSPTTKKERVTKPASKCPVAWFFIWKGLRSVSWDNRRIVVAASGYKPLHRWKMVGPSTAASCSTLTRPTGENWSKASSSLYLGELLIQKCKFRHQVVASTLCLEKHSPKGSCHLDESSMNHTLAQNSHCEFWCGMYLTCKNNPFIPDRNWLMTRGEKQCEGNLSTSLLEATYPSKPSGYFSWQIATRVQ